MEYQFRLGGIENDGGGRGERKPYAIVGKQIKYYI